MALRDRFGMLAGSLALAVAVSGCDFSGDFLFSKVEGLPSIYQLTAEDGGPVVPAVINDFDDLQAATIYGEIAPANTSAYGGVTFTFLGTGDTVCIWVDPEVASWNTAISRNPTDDGQRWTYPDNLFDDGDIDLFAGLSVYYTGSPGVLGDFEVAYEDSLGNGIEISLAGCPNRLSDSGGSFAHAGKGLPEWCSLSTVGAAGVSHTVVLQNFATPLDDSRLAFGVVLAEGSCENLYGSLLGDGGSGGGIGGGGVPVIDPITAECLIRGEALEPLPLEGTAESYTPYYGLDAASVQVWAGSVAFEDEFCNAERIARFCRQEANAVKEAGKQCSWESFDAADYDPGARCYCGNPENVPVPGEQ